VKRVKYICDAPDAKTWFGLETEAEAAAEAQLMNHAVEKHFRREWEKASASFVPASPRYIEQEIGRTAHILHTMPLFLTLRDSEGGGLATAMLPPGGRDDAMFRIIIVGPNNGDPYPAHGAAIAALGAHFGLALDRDRCFPYRRD
jgi:hypothetical protein